MSAAADRVSNDQVMSRLRQIRACNTRIGFPERARGLHYWLGFEYALALTQMDVPRGARVLDIGTGAYSIWPYVLAHVFACEAVAVDLSSTLDRQTAVRERAVRAGLCRREQVHLVRADARRLPFAACSFEAFTAISSLEHVENEGGDRRALQEAARILCPDGCGVVSVPFRYEGSLSETDHRLRLYQRHYSPTTLARSLLGPSGLKELLRTHYGERVPVYRLLRRLPRLARNAIRPWNAALTARSMSVVTDRENASAVMLFLSKEVPSVDGDSAAADASSEFRQHL